jgi:hypothetical protein
LNIIFNAFKKGLEKFPESFRKVHLTFIGTNYAIGGKKTIEPLASKLLVDEYVTEIPSRIPFFETLFLLKQADMLVVPGSIDDSYTASKIYPYILSKKPLLAVFNKNSSVIEVLEDLGYNTMVKFDENDENNDHIEQCYKHFQEILAVGKQEVEINKEAFEPYTAKSKTRDQIEFFEQIINNPGN